MNGRRISCIYLGDFIHGKLQDLFFDGFSPVYLRTIGIDYMYK
jgi:hypothetical protein